MKALLVLVLLASQAHAETPEQLTQTARNIARDGRCEALPVISARVRALDPDYYARVYAVDPVIVGCLHVDAHLQLGGPPSVTPPSPIRAAAPVRIGDSKSPDTALALSLGTTAVGLGLMIEGSKIDNGVLGGLGAVMFFVGPTTGHMYAGDTFNGGLGIRSAGLLSTVLGLAMAFCFDGCNQGTQQSVGGAMFYGGALLYIGGSLYEIGTAPSAAHRYNREHGLDSTVVPTGNGLAVVGTF